MKLRVKVKMKKKHHSYPERRNGSFYTLAKGIWLLCLKSTSAVLQKHSKIYNLLELKLDKKGNKTGTKCSTKINKIQNQ